MKKIFMMLPVMVALVALVGCNKSTSSSDPVPGEDLKENDPYYNAFNIANFGIFGEEPVMIPGTQTQVEISEGVSVNVQLGYSDFCAWDGNLTFNENTGAFSGNGKLITGTVPLYFITDGEYAGYYLTPSNGIKVVANASTPAEGVMQAGVIDAATYGAWIDYMYFNVGEPDQETVFSKTYGTLFSVTDAENEVQESAYGLYRGTINKMVINLDENGGIASWGADVNYANMTATTRVYGFYWDGKSESLKTPYNYRSVNKVFHQEVLNPAPSAPARNAEVKVRTIAKPYPALKK